MECDRGRAERRISLELREAFESRGANAGIRVIEHPREALLRSRIGESSQTCSGIASQIRVGLTRELEQRSERARITEARERPRAAQRSVRGTAGHCGQQRLEIDVLQWSAGRSLRRRGN